MFFRDDPAKKARRHEAWKRIRERGRFWFVLTRGVLGAGVIFLLLISNSLIRGELVNAGFMLFTAAWALPLGIIWALLMWRGKEAQYRISTQKGNSG